MREVEHDEGSRWFKTSVVDEEAIDHERQIGAVKVVGEIIRIRVAQRVDFDLLADPICVKPSPPRITLGEMFEMDDVMAEHLVARVSEAITFALKIGGTMWLPRLVAEA